MRNGFSLIPILIAILVAGAIGTVAGPSIMAYIDRTKVDDLVAKEQLLRDAFINYYRASGYDASIMPQNAQALIQAAINDKLLPKIDASSSSATAVDIAYYRSNGFGGNIEVGLNGAILNIESNIPSSKSFARRYYQNATGKLYPGYEGGGEILGHQYALAGDMMKHVQLINAMAEKASTAGATTDSATAVSAGKKWWDYNPASDAYQVKSWNGSSWSVEKTVYANNGTITSFTGSGSNLTTVVGDTASTSAAAVAEGTVMTDSNGRQYVSVNGSWKPIGSSLMLGDINATSAGSVSGGTTLAQLNPDGSVSQYIAIGGSWYQFGSGSSSGGGAFIEPIFDLPATVYPKGSYIINATHPAPDLISGYQWESESGNFNLSSPTGQSTTITLSSVDVGSTVILNLRAISTAGIASTWISKSLAVSMPTPTIVSADSADNGGSIALDAIIKASDNSDIAGASYLWTTTAGTLSSTTVKNPTLSSLPTSGSSVTVTLMASKNSKSSVIASKTITLIPQKPTVALSSTTTTMSASDFIVDADSNDALVGTTNNAVAGESAWEVVVTKGNGTTQTFTSDYFTISSSDLGDSYIGSCSVRARYQKDGVWSNWSDSVAFSVKPPKPTLTLPTHVYYTEPAASFSANANGATGTTFTFTFVNGTPGTQTSNTILWVAPTLGTATIKVKQSKNGIDSIEDGPYSINLVTMNTPTITNNHYDTDLVSVPNYYYLNTPASTAGSKSLSSTFVAQGSGSVTYSWANYTGDESDITYTSATSQTTAYTCGIAGATNIGIVVTHRGVSKTATTDIECGGFEAKEY